MKTHFPTGFAWGVATAALQIEGGVSEGGRGVSIWDEYARRPGVISGGEDPSVACDHFHRFESDFDLMASLGIQHYRFSIAWPRIYPDGLGNANEEGLIFYDRMVDALLERNIAPYVTLYHWDLPQALEIKGGWQSRETVEAFSVFSATVVKRLRDRVNHWFTLNEIPSFVGHGYGKGRKAPGLRLNAKALNQVYHHALMAHGRAVQVVREYGGNSAEVGIVHNPDVPVPFWNDEPNIAAAREHFHNLNSHLMAPLYLGQYDEKFLQTQGTDAPLFTDADLAIISTPCDFLGLNIYTGGWVVAQNSGFSPVPIPPGYPCGSLPWLRCVPESIYWGIRLSADCFGVKAFYISENGFCHDESFVEPPQHSDPARREYMRSYLKELHEACKDGYQVKGYFHWSFLDNFEWTEGFKPRFGLVAVNYQNQNRTPRLSAKWYSCVARENGF